MESFKNALIFPPVIVLPNSIEHISLDTDACNVQASFVLLQEHPDTTTNPAGRWYHSWVEAMRLYATTQRNCLAIVGSILLLRP